MQGPAWINILQQVPLAYHDKLMLVTAAGTEISIQSVVRMEDDYLLLRGRLAGTTDTGRAFFLPYDQINYLGFQQAIPEAELRAFYGDKADTAPVAVATPAADAAPPPAVEEAPLIAEDVPPGPPKQTPLPEPPKTTVRAPVVGKNSILERLRARSHSGGGSHSGTGVKPAADK
jgi:hypothetical protein